MEIVVMPKLGFNMDEGTLTSWYKKEGDPVRKGEALFSIETDKTNIDVEATQDGVVRKLFIGEGEKIPVTLPIAIIAEVGEEIAAAVEEALALLEDFSISDAPAAPAPADSGQDVSASACDFDVFVIGGGPGGYVAAIRAAQLGLRTAIAEKESFGGVCLNKGCIPTKAFLRSVEALNETKGAEAYGIVGVDVSKAALDMARVQARKKAVVGQLVSGVQGLLQKNKVKIIMGEANIVGKNTVTVNQESYRAASIILATGSAAKGLPAGIVQKKTVLTSDTVLELEALPDEIAIIGGGVIGIEFAYFFAGAGAKVSVVEFLERILPPVDAEIAELVRQDLAALGIDIYTSAKVTKVTEGAVEFEQAGQAKKIKTKNVLMAVGRAPSIPAGAEKLGIKTSGGAIVTDGRLRTSVPGVYAIGDANGKMMLAHTASAEGIVAAENIAGHDSVMDYDSIPSAIYIRPEVASAGLTEEAAREKFGDVKIGKFPLFANGKSLVEGDAKGLAKVITEAKYGEILGVHLYCLHATDIIAEAVTAMKAEATAAEIAAAVHPHPTVSEAVQEAFHAALGGAIHM
ncbi:MAG: dihydrolipoyl dehydrogenase [Clostridiales Family XIII bacterium]|jgi:dihydrolipoamide dehydrogenase|nr:dihydrolipoyl dehydrogenase [Clostridiales Family XIII bacterium]